MEKINIQVKVKKENREMIMEGKQGQNLLEVLRNNFMMSGDCSGNGTCGKCKVKILSGELPVSESERQLLTEEEIRNGIRLACKAVMKTSGEMTENALSVEVAGIVEEDIVVESVVAGEQAGVDGIEDCITEEQAGIGDIEDCVTEEQAGIGDIEDCITEEQAGIGDIEDCITEEQKEINESSYFIAMDVGTTTIAMALVEEETGEVCDTYTCLNHQRKFGADVISRITASNEGKGKELKALIEEDLWKGIQRLVDIEEREEDKTAENKYKEKKAVLTNIAKTEKKNESEIRRIIIAGNTTMLHLLMGYSCQSLGKYPFVSDYLGQKDCLLGECITISQKSKYECIPVTILPGISVFTGADVVAGILACPGFEQEEISLLIDLGTNGEMVLGNKDKIMTTSVAAGPAFEGGNISCGTASIPGAISKVKIENQRAVIKTINSKMPPVGICGTGVISIIAQLKKNRIMDEMGNLKYPYNKRGFPLWKDKDGAEITITQKDIREFQMAKAAIRSGIEILISEYGGTINEIDKVYLAGGFGMGLSVEDAIDTGILPMEFKEKVESVGNSALKGSIIWGRWKSIGKSLDRKRKIENVALTEEKEFQEIYIKYVNFLP